MPTVMAVQKKVLHNMEPGPVTARLRIEERGYCSPVSSIDHHLMLHEDGTVTESGYVCHAMQVIMTFEEPRIWDPALLDGYVIYAEKFTFLSRLEDYRREPKRSHRI